ncbi:HNH endonuclease [Haloterrigena sp. SYSU A558-1]|uniref:HNH endonuclease n=1 Tax=Haloterrigena gelatinilytica TaxID=2741724 RepID=A0A8J8GHH3_9EURY|nr:HNH endonuclease [Haloterrigena gelatinilytica]NUB90068.1 HNH endonuclease [Haloterrigena gelatinilytica]NUC74107.1 HNH endonuclease [Haloterrigena gelatinilytica]
MTTEAECLEALREAAQRLRESPTKAQYEELELTPASATIIRTCGGWNGAKEKAGLETSYSRGSRVGPKPDDVELSEETSWADLTVDQRWHYRNADWNTERSLDRRARHRAWVYEYKHDQGCNRCDEDDPRCLDLHHIDEDEKVMAVGKMVSFGYSKDRIESVIEKCIVLCANCHRKEHYEPRCTDYLSS